MYLDKLTVLMSCRKMPRFAAEIVVRRRLMKAVFFFRVESRAGATGMTSGHGGRRVKRAIQHKAMGGETW